MRHRPTPTVLNGCAPLALAATLGGEDKDYVRCGRGRTMYAGRFTGLTDGDVERALKKAGLAVEIKSYVWTCRRVRLADALPVSARGIVSVRRGHRYHALAFDGKMVYDNGTVAMGGGWRWVYDHPMARWHVRRILTVRDSS